MFKDKKVIVVMPAYNAEHTLIKTYNEVMAQGVVDMVIVVDDASQDKTVSVASSLENTKVYVHPSNMGYGANQKTCYKYALENGADIVIMVHPDYQYTPKLIPAMVTLIGNGLYDCVLASRILGGRAVKDGMPLWRYIANRFLTFTENVLMGTKLSEFHTGYRAFSRQLLEQIPIEANSNDFVFDNQMLAQIAWYDFATGEISCPARYAADASSINFRRSVKYGFGCLATALIYRLAKWGFISPKKVFLAKYEND